MIHNDGLSFFVFCFLFFFFCYFLFFFFSSRRRHTRSTRDWSSDVCSSDLVAMQQFGGRNGEHAGPGAQVEEPMRAARLQHAIQRQQTSPRGAVMAGAKGQRSEERRVGKECRYGWEWEE